MFALIAFFVKKEDKKQENNDTFYVKMPKFITVFFLVVAILGVVGSVALTIIFVKDETAAIVLLILGGFFALLGLIGYVYARFTYLLVDGDKITVHRLFRKTVEYAFDDIAYFKIKNASAPASEVVCYNKDGKKMFGAEAMSVGFTLFIDKMRQRGIPQKMA
jgi:predicted membrane channel-forming protein YqfA (hemolysin III family)